MSSFFDNDIRRLFPCFESSLDFFLWNKLTFTDTRTTFSFINPRFFRLHHILPEWVCPALEGPCVINCAAMRREENAVIIRRFLKRDKGIRTKVNKTTVPGDKFIKRNGEKRCCFLDIIFCKIYIPWFR